MGEWKEVIWEVGDSETTRGNRALFRRKDLQNALKSTISTELETVPWGYHEGCVQGGGGI